MYTELIRAARLVAEAVDPHGDEADESTTMHPAVLKALRESGLARHAVPAEFGGASESVDPLALTVIREVLMSSSAHLDTMFAMQGLGSHPLVVGGTAELRSDWLPKVANLEAIPAIALTEPEVGSDLRAIRSTMVERGQSLLLNGRKSFITNATVADFFCVLAKEGDGYSMALVPRDTPGVEVTEGHPLIAPHVMGEVSFDDVEVPLSHRLGNSGEGFSIMLRTLAVFRVSVAGAAVGLATAALQEARAHSLARMHSGKPLAQVGAVAQLLAQGWADTEAARALAYRAAREAQSDPMASLHLTSMAKVVATEAAGRVVDTSVQVMGRFGLITGSKIERLYRNARPLRVYEGSTEVLLDALARQLSKSEALLEFGGGLT